MKTPKYIGLLAALTLTSISHLQSAIINWLETPESITISASGIGGFEEHPEFLSPSGNWKFTLRQRASSYFRQDGIRQFELETRSILTWLGDQSLIDPSLLGSGRPIIFTIPYIDFYRLDDDGSIMYFNGREFVERSPFFTTMSWRGLGWDGRATLTITDMPDLQDSSTWTWGAIYSAHGPSLAVPESGSTAGLLAIGLCAIVGVIALRNEIRVAGLTGDRGQS